MGEPRSWGEFMEALVKLIGQAADTGGSQTAGTVMAKGNAILAVLKNGGMPIVKSVQRGVAYISKNNDLNIAINAVDPNKCIVITSGTSGYNGSSCHYSYVKSLEATKLTLGNNQYSNAAMSWEVVEFH